MSSAILTLYIETPMQYIANLHILFIYCIFYIVVKLTIFRGDFFLDFAQSLSFSIIITRTHHKISQNTYMRSNHRVQESRILHKMKIYDHGLSPLLMQPPI